MRDELVDCTKRENFVALLPGETAQEAARRAFAQYLVTAADADVVSMEWARDPCHQGVNIVRIAGARAVGLLPGLWQCLDVIEP